MRPANVLGEWARLLVETLAAAGVRDVVISPGSRSTPFVWAALEQRELRCHVLIDERTAGFFALGQARLSGVPSALICTSGSALANYLPAVAEAALSATPLIVLSADRPYELMACGAAQTFDQVKIFGAFTRSFVDLGLPDESPSALQGLQRALAQAVHTARFPVPGPVHLNARARKPLEPQPANTDEERALNARVTELVARQPAVAERPTVLPAPQVLDGLARACAAAERGVIVCGPLPLADAGASVAPAALHELGRVTGFPIWCEATSQVRFAAEPGATLCDAFDWLCRSERLASGAAPDLVLQFGRPPTASSYESFLARHAGTPRYLVAPYDWPDPPGSATTLVRGDVSSVVHGLCARLRESPRAPGAWARRWARANELAWDVVEQEVSRDPSLCEAVAVRAVIDALPAGSVLCVGNSLPVRELDWFCRASERRLQVCSQRGLNGIDGLISGAAGVASVADSHTTLIIGDVSFLHDVGGLYAARELDRPLTIVVLNNDGGRIFEQLPLLRGGAPAAVPDARAWLTPHALPLEHASQLYGLSHTRVTTLDALNAALHGRKGSGARVIEVCVPGRSTSALLASIAERVDAALAAANLDAPR